MMPGQRSGSGSLGCTTEHISAISPELSSHRLITVTAAVDAAPLDYAFCDGVTV
jgi:hypothetical protein